MTAHQSLQPSLPLVGSLPSSVANDYIEIANDELSHRNLS